MYSCLTGNIGGVVHADALDQVSVPSVNLTLGTSEDWSGCGQQYSDIGIVDGHIPCAIYSYNDDFLHKNTGGVALHQKCAVNTANAAESIVGWVGVVFDFVHYESGYK